MIPSTSFGTGRTQGVRIWLATEPVDMRRSFDRLAEHVRTQLSDDPTSGHLFVFRNRTSERVKILWWDRDGYALYYKRRERGTFQFPAVGENAVAFDSKRLMELLSGYDRLVRFRTCRPHSTKRAKPNQSHASAQI